MPIDATLVKDLREKTGAGVLDCQKALTQSGGDIAKAIDFLRQKGLALAQKKAGRTTNDGLIVSYIHAGSKLGVLLEVNCETDFVAKTDDFQELGRDLAMHIAAADPRYLQREDVPPAVLEKEKEIFRAQAKESGKPEAVLDKIVAGRLEKFYAELCLLEQPFVKDPGITIKDLLGQRIAKLGENISVRRFTRFRLGEMIGE
ncbi:MAG TPA: translation elongation factor Ts [Nitrospiria bacterium]|jgi:elongation factor Ts|nr:translation elongation factor Ts [Nitrospiria bacterium]